MLVLSSTCHNMPKSRTNIWSYLFQPRCNYWNSASTGVRNVGTRFHSLIVADIEHHNLAQTRIYRLRFITVYGDLTRDAVLYKMPHHILFICAGAVGKRLATQL